jgi:TrpR-related protein YerC/YecD
MKSNKHESLRQRKKNENILFGALAALNGGKEVGNFLKDLCTPAELQALVDRWQVVNLLEQDISYRQIHDMTGVSVTTVGRVARFLMDGFGGYRTALSRMPGSNQNK